MDKLNFLALFILLLLAQDAIAQNWDPRLQNKVEKAIINAFSIEDYTLNEIDGIDIPLAKKPFLAEVKGADKVVGSVYVGQAPSMKNVFDYILFFNNDWIITGSKILIYREQHGRQIAHPRWLKQFIGYDLSQRPNLGEDIDGLSGATISAQGMTSSVKEVLSQIEKLLVSYE